MTEDTTQAIAREMVATDLRRGMPLKRIKVYCSWNDYTIRLFLRGKGVSMSAGNVAIVKKKYLDRVRELWLAETSA